MFSSTFKYLIGARTYYYRPAIKPDETGYSVSSLGSFKKHLVLVGKNRSLKMFHIFVACICTNI